jgi:hypothetical protein
LFRAQFINFCNNIIISIFIPPFDCSSADNVSDIIIGRLRIIIFWRKEIIIPRHYPRNAEVKEEIKFWGKIIERRWRRMSL